MTTNSNTIYLNYCHEIIQAKVTAFMAMCTQITQKNHPENLYISFSSPGGNIAPGINLYNFLLSLPTKIIMHNIGAVDSISTVIFLAGEERYANPHSSFLFHGVQANFTEKSSLTLAQLKERVSATTEDQNKMANIITERTELSDSDISQLFLQGDVKSPDWAQEKGFINDISQLSIPKDAISLSFNM